LAIVTLLQVAACSFRQLYKQLQRHDSVYPSSVYAIYNFSSSHFIFVPVLFDFVALGLVSLALSQEIVWEERL